MTIPEYNISRLLRHAYQPAPCRAEFREELCRLLVMRVGASPSARHWRLAAGLALAASLLIGVGVAIWWSASRAGGASGDGVDLRADLRGGVRLGNTNFDGGPSGVNGSGVGIPTREDAGAGAGSRPDSEPGGPPRMAAGPEAAKTQLSGRVVDGATGAPVPDFTIVALRETRLPALPGAVVREVHDPDGRFQLAGLPSGGYSITALASGFAAGRKVGIEVGELAPAESLVFELDRGGRVRGRVVDAETGEPIDGAIVLSESDTPLSYLWSSLAQLPEKGATGLTTRADGAFDFLHLSAGIQQLRASKPGFAPVWSDPIPLAVGRDVSGVVLKMQHGGGIRGTVRSSTGAPLPGITVSAAMNIVRTNAPVTVSQAKTNHDGTYELKNLSAGLHAVYVELHEPASRATSHPAGEGVVKPATVQDGQWTTLDFGGLHHKSRLYGRIESAGVELDPKYTIGIMPTVFQGTGEMSWKAAVPDAEGRYEFNDIDSTSYRICLATAFGLDVIVLGEVDVPEASDKEANYVLKRGVMSGLVCDAATGLPLSRAVVVLLHSDASGRTEFVAKVQTDSSGKFAIPHISNGGYDVIVYATSGDYAFERLPAVSVGSESAGKDLVVRLGPGAEIRTRVRDASGKPVANVGIRFFDAAGVETPFAAPPQTTDAAGAFVARGARLGVWRAVIERDGKKIGEGSIDAARPGTHALEITAQP
jgi:5-hydroxyisourate hydrolase-like protein (transthyretin family)